mgnify:CR=1 FL=1
MPALGSINTDFYKLLDPGYFKIYNSVFRQFQNPDSFTYFDEVKRLVDKYNESGPRYTSYPPATFFNEYFGEKEYLDAVLKSNSERPENITVYIHFKF